MWLNTHSHLSLKAEKEREKIRLRVTKDVDLQVTLTAQVARILRTGNSGTMSGSRWLRVNELHWSVEAACAWLHVHGWKTVTYAELLQMREPQ